MGKPKIYLTRPLFDAARQLLSEHFEVEYWTSRSESRAGSS